MTHSINRQWFVPGDGIAREVITADIQRYLGPDATVRPGLGTGDQDGMEGFWITAYRTLTSQMIADLKLDSQRWRQEIAQGQRDNPRQRVSYQDSTTHQSRQYYGPSTPAPPADYAAPQQPPSANYGGRPYGDAYTYAAQPQPGYPQQAQYAQPSPYGQTQVRTAPQYSYTHGSQPASHDPYAQPTQDPRYTYQQHPSAPPQRSADPYAQTQRYFGYSSRTFWSTAKPLTVPVMPMPMHRTLEPLTHHPTRPAPMMAEGDSRPALLPKRSKQLDEDQAAYESKPKRVPYRGDGPLYMN